MDLRLLLCAPMLLVAACAAAPATTGAGAVPSIADSSTSASGEPDTGTSPAGVVPWADLPPAHEQLPVYRVPPSPDPAPAEAAPPCRANQLHLTIDPADGAGGRMFEPLVLHLVGRTPCAVDGIPDVRFLGAAVPVDSHPGDMTPVDYRHPVLLTTTATTAVPLASSRSACLTCGRPGPTTRS